MTAWEIAIKQALGTLSVPDPFYRMLVAQARLEGLTLLTSDRRLVHYGPFLPLV